MSCGFFKSKIIATPTAIILATTTTTLAIATLFNRVGEEEDEKQFGRVMSDAPIKDV